MQKMEEIVTNSDIRRPLWILNVWWNLLRIIKHMNNSIDPILNRKILQMVCKPQYKKRCQCLLRVAVYDVTWSALLRDDVIGQSRRHAYSVVGICLLKTYYIFFIHDKPIGI